MTCCEVTQYTYEIVESNDLVNRHAWMISPMAVQYIISTSIFMHLITTLHCTTLPCLLSGTEGGTQGMTDEAN